MLYIYKLIFKGGDNKSLLRLHTNSNLLSGRVMKAALNKLNFQRSDSHQNTLLSKMLLFFFSSLLIKRRGLIISADSRVKTGTENSKRLDRSSMFALCIHSLQSEHINTPCCLTPNTNASEMQMIQ